MGETGEYEDDEEVPGLCSMDDNSSHDALEWTRTTMIELEFVS